MVVAVTPEATPTTFIGWAGGARYPKGASAEGLAEEIDRIAEEYGAASLDTIKAAIKADPDSFPNFWLWLPKSQEEAWDIAITEAIGKACRSVVRYTISTDEKGEESKSPAVRVFYVASNSQTGERGYQRIDVIAQDSDKVLELFDSLRHEEQVFQDKADRVKNEIRELLRIQGR